jgi:hypothetical protein
MYWEAGTRFVLGLIDSKTGCFLISRCVVYMVLVLGRFDRWTFYSKSIKPIVKTTRLLTNWKGSRRSILVIVQIKIAKWLVKAQLFFYNKKWVHTLNVHFLIYRQSDFRRWEAIITIDSDISTLLMAQCCDMNWKMDWYRRDIYYFNYCW